jgi:uncharacterized protein YsxB (DUF464 family)
MTKIKIRKQGDFIYSLEIKGHSGYGEEGADIVCSGISCIAQTAVLGIFNIAKINAEYEINEEYGFLKLVIPFDISESQKEKSNIILQTAMLGLADMQEGFSNYIKMEVLDDVY